MRHYLIAVTVVPAIFLALFLIGEAAGISLLEDPTPWLQQAGWFAAEMGRQPWIVYGLLRTIDGLSEAVSAEQVLFSLILFAVVYTLLLVLFLYLLNKKIRHGPTDDPDISHQPQHEEMAEIAARRLK